jgi:quinoprotein relay system zinc metallohydrolase 2
MNRSPLAFAALMMLLATLPCRAADLAPLPVGEIADGVFVYAAPYELASAQNAGAIANTAFVVGKDAVAVIDTGGSYLAGRRLLAAIAAHTDRPVRYVINTHVHPDHVLGNAAFVREGVSFVGHEHLPDALGRRAAQYLARMQDLVGTDVFAGTRVVGPTTLVNGRLELDLGHRRLVLEAWPTAHTNSDLTVLDEKTGTWFLGDLLFSGHVPALDGSLRGWLRVLAALAARPAARVVPGHGPPSLAWPEAAAPIVAYLERLAADTRGMIGDGRTMQEAAASAARSEAPRWQLFDEFNARNATTAFHELEWE